MDKSRHFTRLGLMAAATVVMGAASASASAQAGFAVPASASATAKSDAILGGPSRLAALMAQQSGAPAPDARAPATLQPAGFSRPRSSFSALTIHTPGAAEPVVKEPISLDRPDVFGSVALRVGRTSLDDRWRKVERARVSGTPSSYASSLRSLAAVDRAEAINRYVNKRIAFVDDARQYGRADLWSAASDTLRRGRGDCEDYAIAKLQMLRAAGIADRDLYLVILKDLVRRSDHAVLVVRAGGRMLVLDNGTDVVADASTMVDYRPILTFSASGTWTHGYRRHSAPVQIAAADVQPLTPAGGPSSAE